MKNLIRLFMFIGILSLTSCDKEGMHQQNNQYPAVVIDYVGMSALITVQGSPMNYWPKDAPVYQSSPTKGWIFNAQLETGQRIVLFTPNNTRAMQINNNLGRVVPEAELITIGMPIEVISQDGYQYEFYSF